HRPAGRPRAFRQILVGNRIAGHRPYARERVLDRRHGTAADLDAGIAPRLEAAARIADPVAADAEAGDERDLAVDREHLAVIPRKPAERAFDARRVVAAHLDAAVTEPCPEASRGLREVAHPVVDQPDLHAFGRFRDQRIGELETDLVLA